jgi:hypothetical protein
MQLFATAPKRRFFSPPEALYVPRYLIHIVRAVFRYVGSTVPLTSNKQSSHPALVYLLCNPYPFRR